MKSEKIILRRFMSRAEYDKYMSGEILRNTTDHYRQGKGGSTSFGFCFFRGDVREWAHRLNGLVSFDVLLTVEFDFDSATADVLIGTGVYADDPSAEFPVRKKFREFSTPAYSRKAFPLVSADFSYADNPEFIPIEKRIEIQKLIGMKI